jgi:hypothetical protein
MPFILLTNCVEVPYLSDRLNRARHNAGVNGLPLDVCQPVLPIQIRRIHMFLGLLDPDPVVRGTDPAPDSFYHQAK